MIKKMSLLKRINLPQHLCIYIIWSIFECKLQYYEITELVILKTYTTWLSERESLARHCVHTICINKDILIQFDVYKKY